ncbi:MAG TPA: hypothetical protein VHN80_31425 [Kineosporiaceae bacterium]|nr:hypothetical protein [Kineosporiaceae bacterium]
MDREQVLAAYERAWAGQDEESIRQALAACWTATSTYVSPITDSVRGIDALTSLILDFPVMFPGATMQLLGPPNAHHDVACCSWRLTSTARIRTLGRDYGMALGGVDFIQFTDDGLISMITAFYDMDSAANPAHADAATPRRLNGGTVRSGYGGRVIDLDSANPESDLAYESG